MRLAPCQIQINVSLIYHDKKEPCLHKNPSYIVAMKNSSLVLMSMIVVCAVWSGALMRQSCHRLLEHQQPGGEEPPLYSPIDQISGTIRIYILFYLSFFSKLFFSLGNYCDVLSSDFIYWSVSASILLN